MPAELAIESDGLTKWYGPTQALRGVALNVPAGTVTAVLGPNGAGKTTAVRILTTLTTPDAGTARVAGFDVVNDPQDVRRRIGLAAQDATVDPLLTGRENLVMLGQLHQLERRAAGRRADALLDEFSLSDAGGRLVGGYSGGMRRRLDLAATLVSSPDVLFLDEPTTGLDPRARQELWAVLDTLVGHGTTVLLTTQYLDEAERLADDIVVIDHGRIIAQGDAPTLKRTVGGDTIQAVAAAGTDLAAVAQVIGRTCHHEATVDEATRTVSAPAEHGLDALLAAGAALRDAGLAVADLSLRQPTLDEVFLTLTGSTTEQGEPS